MPRLKDAITGLVERLSGPYKGMPYLRYFESEEAKKTYLDFYKKATSGAADAPRSRRVSEGVYAEVHRSRGPAVGTTYNRFFKTEAERDIFLKRAQERAENAAETTGVGIKPDFVAKVEERMAETSVPTTANELKELMEKAASVNTPIGAGSVKASVEGEATRRAARRSKANAKR